MSWCGPPRTPGCIAMVLILSDGQRDRFPTDYCRDILHEGLSSRFWFGGGFGILRRARPGPCRDSHGQPIVVSPPWVDHHDAFIRDDIFADILAMVAAAHFYDHHHLPELTVDLHIAKPDNVVGEE